MDRRYGEPGSSAHRRPGRLCAALALAAPSGAGAHAVLQSSEPARGAALDRAPGRVVLRFDEAVESSFGAVRVYDAKGERVDSGEVERPSSESVAIGLQPGLPDGPYTATYRVLSADSHPVSGGFVFTVGRSAGASAASVADLVDSGSAGPVTQVAFGVARSVAYAATALLVGGLLFAMLVWPRALGTVSDGGERRRSASRRSPPGRWSSLAPAPWPGPPPAPRESCFRERAHPARRSGRHWTRPCLGMC